MPWPILHYYHINVNFVHASDSFLSTVHRYKVYAYCTRLIDLAYSSDTLQFQRFIQTGNKLVSEK